MIHRAEELYAWGIGPCFYPGIWPVVTMIYECREQVDE
jgi:hypothetical protein